MGRAERWVFLRPAARWAVVSSAAALLTLCLNGTIAIPAVSYFAYLYSTYALVVFCVWLPGAFRRGKSGAISRLERFCEAHPCFAGAGDLIRDPERRVRALLVPSLAFNLGYAAFKLGVGIWLGSWWMIGVGAYYAILAGLRYALLRSFFAGSDRRSAARDWRTYRNTAFQLLILTVAMNGLIVQTVRHGEAYRYPGVLIYAFALYAFVKIISAATLLVRKRREENAILAASRCVSLACALMSMMALQTALISRFGDEAFARTANALFGGVVCLVMLCVCGRMLSRYHRHIRKSEG